MKTVKMLFAAIIVAGLSFTACAQSEKTETFKVGGSCGMCESRIEKAAKVEGVSKADWSAETKSLTLVYNPSKVSSETVQKKIASVGHDAGKIKADEQVYSKLPGCCKYERLK